MAAAAWLALPLEFARLAAASLGTCPGCDERPPAGGGPCSQCLARLAHPTVSSDVVALGRYHGPLGAVLRAGKFSSSAFGLDTVGALLGEVVREAGLSGLPVVPVPRHPRRRARYGVDAAERLARASRTGPVVLALRRRGTAAPASRTPRARREARLRGSFVLAPDAHPLARGPVVLLDDVLTTGATARAARDALARGGIEIARLAVAALA